MRRSASLHQAIRLKPDYANAHINLGYLLQEQGKIEEAYAECKEAVRVEPANAEAHNRGTALQEQGKFEEAYTEYKEAVRLEPANTGAHYEPRQPPDGPEEVR